MTRRIAARKPASRLLDIDEIEFQRVRTSEGRDPHPEPAFLRLYLCDGALKILKRSADHPYRLAHFWVCFLATVQQVRCLFHCST